MNYTLHHGDCLEFLRTLPSGSVDAVVTSPPYAMQRAAQYGGIPEAEYPAWTVNWLDALRNALADDGSVLLNIREHVRDGEMSDYVHRTRMAVRAAGWIECDEIAWIKPDAPPLGDVARPRRSWERVLWFSPIRRPFVNPRGNGKHSDRLGLSGRPKDFINGTSNGVRSGTARHTDTVSVPVARNATEHPAVFPVGLAEYLVRGWSRPDATILDPFTGSGTTGIACMQTGRKFIGCEIDPGYFEIARKRIEAAVPLQEAAT